MTLSPNTRLGRYEIRLQIGAGGMGEVYRARDEKLNRDVAIKILPASLSQHDGHVYGLELPVQIEELVVRLVSELLEGETLPQHFIENRTQRKNIRPVIQLFQNG
jgi:serine/threonine protein kinase